LRTAVRPDPKFVKWINPDIRRGEQRDVAVMVGEGGGIFALDRRSGQFLWANPFLRCAELPDQQRGRQDRQGHPQSGPLFKRARRAPRIRYWNTRSYWPTAYHPRLNALFVPWVDNCLDMTSAFRRRPTSRP
jgi:hypothetical protein